MRLENISNVAAANAFLPSFINDRNERFAIEPADATDMHRSTEGFDIEQILCRHEERVVTKNLMFQLKDASFALVDPYSRRTLVTGSRVQIFLHLDRPMVVLHETHELVAERVAKLPRQVPVIGSKDLNAHLDRRIANSKKAHIPAANHPWKTFPNPP